MALDALKFGQRGNYIGRLGDQWYVDNSGLSGLMFGPAGFGKGTKYFYLNGLTSGRNRSSRAPGGSLIYNDPKIESYPIIARQQRALGKKTFLLNPAGLNEDWQHENLKTSRYNPVSLAPGPLDPGFDPYIDNLAEGVFLDTGGDKYWSLAGRSLGAGILAFSRGAASEHQSFCTAFDILKSRGDEFIAFMQLLHDSGIRKARTAAAPYLQAEVPRSAWEVLESASQQISWAGVPELRKVFDGPSDFTHDDVKRGDVMVCFGLPEQLSKLYPTFPRSHLAPLLQACLLPPLFAPVRFYIDEAGVCFAGQTLSSLETIFSLGRGSLTTAICAFQNLPQARSVFGEKNFSSMMASCGTQTFMTPNDPETCAYIANRLGERAALQLGYDGYRWKPTGGAMTVPVMRQHQLYGFPRDRFLIFEQGCADGIVTEGVPYHDVPMLDRVANKNPYWEAKKAAGLA